MIRWGRRTPSAKLGPNFSKLLGATAVSSVGDGVYLTALPLLALEFTHDPRLLGLIGAAGELPWLLLSLHAGALVDRWDHRRVMWRVDAARFVIVVGLWLAVLTSHANVAWLVAVAFLLGCGQAFFDVAAPVLLPGVVSRDERSLVRANGRMTAALMNGQDLLGPPLGAGLFSLGQSIPLLGNALSFAASSALIGSIRGRFVSVGDQSPRQSLHGEIREGLVWMVRHRVLRATALTGGLSNAVFSAKAVLLVLLARDVLHLGNFGYGVLLLIPALGGLVGSVVGPWLATRIGPGTMRCGGMVVEGLVIAGLGLSSTPWFAGLMMAIAGFTMSLQFIIVGSLKPRIVPARLLGRVTGAGRLIGLAGTPVGSLLGGVLAAAFGVRVPFLLGGAMMVLVAGLFYPALSDHSIQKAIDAMRESESLPTR